MLKSHEQFAIHLLHESGHSIRKISHITGYHRKSITNILREPGSSRASERGAKPHAAANYAWFADGPCAPVRERQGRPSRLEPLKAHLVETLSKGAVCAGVLLNELRQQGYTGSRRSLHRFLRAQRAR